LLLKPCGGRRRVTLRLMPSAPSGRRHASFTYLCFFWGVIASPYQLKMQALADSGGLPWQHWPDQKTFQVVVWRELCVHWDALAESDRQYVSHLLPAIADINQSCV